MNSSHQHSRVSCWQDDPEQIPEPTAVWNLSRGIPNHLVSTGVKHNIYIYIYWQILVVYACGNFVQRKQACDGWRFSWESSMTPALQVFDRAAYLRGFETTYWDVIFVQGGRHHLHCFDWTTWYSLNICQTLWPFFWSSWKWDTPADTATLCYTCPFGVGTLLFRVGVLARVCVCVCQFSKRPFCSKRSPGAGTKAGSPRMWAVDFRCLQF